MWITIAFVALVSFAALHTYVLTPARWRKQYGSDWQSYNAEAFHPQRISSDNPHRYSLHRVAEELQSDSGRLAVSLHHGQGSGIVVHELNRDGTFSARGPYFIKRSPCIWAPTGRHHIVEVEVFTAGFKTTNPSGGRSNEVGRRVLELNTGAHRPLTLREYGTMRDIARAKVGPPDGA